MLGQNFLTILVGRTSMKQLNNLEGSCLPCFSIIMHIAHCAIDSCKASWALLSFVICWVGFNILGSNSHSEAKSRSAAIAFFPEQKNPALAIDPPPTNTSRAVSGTENESRRVDLFAKEAEGDMMKEMPCVSTRGPNGRRIEGFLYKYRKGEEVRIVCVCHGRFFTPAEFVKHAGGGDVAHPLRHIVVNPAPASFLWWSLLFTEIQRIDAYHFSLLFSSDELDDLSKV